jgi:hypothetical protein
MKKLATLDSIQFQTRGFKDSIYNEYHWFNGFIPNLNAGCGDGTFTDGTATRMNCCNNASVSAY